MAAAVAVARLTFVTSTTGNTARSRTSARRRLTELVSTDWFATFDRKSKCRRTSGRRCRTASAAVSQRPWWTPATAGTAWESRGTVIFKLVSWDDATRVTVELFLLSAMFISFGNFLYQLDF